MTCFPHKRVKLRVVETCAGSCPKGNPASPNSTICMEEELEKEHHCIKMFHGLIPYIISLDRNAWFKWEKKRDQVTVCCSNTPNNCAVELKKEGKDYRITVRDIIKECPCYEMGRSYLITRTLLDRICLGLFLNIYPYLFSKKNDKVTLSCARSTDSLVGEVCS